MDFRPYGGYCCRSQKRLCLRRKINEFGIREESVRGQKITWATVSLSDMRNPHSPYKAVTVRARNNSLLIGSFERF